MKNKSLWIALILIIGLSSFTQLIPTKLRVFVRNDLGNLVEGASVTLYPTKEDYQKETNPVKEARLTDKKGRVTFDDLEMKAYYLHVEKGDLNNNGGGVMTDTLQEKRWNKVTIVIN